MASLADLSQAVENLLGNKIQQADKSRGELTIQVKASQVVEVCSALRDEESTRFEQPDRPLRCGLPGLREGRPAAGMEGEAIRGGLPSFVSRTQPSYKGQDIS